MKEYIVNEKGERTRVILGIAEYEKLRGAAEEAKRMAEHPGISFRGPEGRRRAWVLGTGFDVWEVVVGYEEMGRERVLRESSLSQNALDAALAYYEAHPEEIDEKIEENRKPLEYWREKYPNLNIGIFEY
ncbi:MAG: hypothetical protein H0U65_06775 [Rubrobacter sp.]|nr:hypothetical protein [Rubrobacter sp.]